MIVCQFINARPDWAPSSLVYMVGINSAKLDVLELGMVYSVFAPVDDKCELVDNPIVAHVTLKHVTGDLLGIKDESGDMWNMIKIMTTDKISVERNKSGKMVISVIPGGQVAKDDSDDVNLTYEKFLNLITQKYRSENEEPGKSDDSDDSGEVDDSDEIDDSDESVNEDDLLTKVSDDKVVSDESDAQKLDKWQVDVLNKMRTLANAHRAQWGHPPIVMPNYTKMDKDDFDDEFNRLAGILSKSHPSAFYGATGVGRIIPSPYSNETKSLIESVNGVKVKSDSHRWGTTHDVLIRFDRKITFPEVIQFLKVYTEWNPDSPDFRSVKVEGCNCKFTIANKNLHPLITGISVGSYGAGARKETILSKVTDDSDSHSSSCDDEEDEDD